MDDHWTRRQFGVLAGATLLVAGAEAAVGLEGVALKLRPVAVDGKLHDFELLGSHPTGLSCRLDLQEARIWRGDVAVPALLWLNDDHPFSRLARPPTAVDLSATERAIATLHLRSHEPPAGAVLKVELNLYDGERTRLVKLAPITIGSKQG